VDLFLVFWRLFLPGKKLGGKKFWSKNHGAPDHKEANYSFKRTSIPKVKR